MVDRGKCKHCGQPLRWHAPILGCDTKGCPGSLKYKAEHSYYPEYDKMTNNLPPEDEAEGGGMHEAEFPEVSA